MKLAFCRVSGGQGKSLTDAQNNRDFTVQKLSSEIHEIIRVLQLTTYDEDEWDADDVTVMKKAQVCYPWLRYVIVAWSQKCCCHWISSITVIKAGVSITLIISLSAICSICCGCLVSYRARLKAKWSKPTTGCRILMHCLVVEVSVQYSASPTLLLHWICWDWVCLGLQLMLCYRM